MGFYIVYNLFLSLFMQYHKAVCSNVKAIALDLNFIPTYLTLPKALFVHTGNAMFVSTLSSVRLYPTVCTVWGEITYNITCMMGKKATQSSMT